MLELTPSPWDRAQLAAPLAPTQGESSWYCFEGAGRGPRGPRRLAGLAWIHRTGPRLSRLGLGPRLLGRDALPPPWRALVPAWLPLLSPVDLAFDDRPLFLVALYDLDAPGARPAQIELTVEHAAFDPETFSAATAGGELALRRLPPAGARGELPAALRAFLGDADPAVALRARCEDFELELHLRGRKPPVTFGEGGAPGLRHGPIEVGYMQRSRLDLAGTVTLRRGAELEVITDFVAEGAQDRHWREATPLLGLRWLWLHLRLAGERELVAYVIRDARGGRRADADQGRELGRDGWLIDPAAQVRRLARFELFATAHADTARGRIPTRFGLEVPELGLAVDCAHAIELPYLPMRAFGDAADPGIYEGPIRVLSSSEPGVSGWLEIVPGQ